MLPNMPEESKGIRWNLSITAKMQVQSEIMITKKKQLLLPRGVSRMARALRFQGLAFLFAPLMTEPSVCPPSPPAGPGGPQGIEGNQTSHPSSNLSDPSTLNSAHSSDCYHPSKFEESQHQHGNEYWNSKENSTTQHF